MILSIDTSASRCAVALVGPDNVWHRAKSMERGHAEALFPMIDEVLAQASAALQDITRIAVCEGPGSFTGIRVGIAGARGLALGLGVPAIGISRLRAIAATQNGPVTVLLPVRGAEVIRQDFAADGEPLTDPLQSNDTLPSPGCLLAGHPTDPDAALADPEVLARLASEAAALRRPAPLYLRPANAAPSQDRPPEILQE